MILLRFRRSSSKIGRLPVLVRLALPLALFLIFYVLASLWAAHEERKSQRPPDAAERPEEDTETEPPEVVSQAA